MSKVADLRSDGHPPRILVFVVAYNAESTILPLLDRIPIADLPGEVEVLAIDDSSSDRTFELGVRRESAGGLPLTFLRTPVNQGYGGNQKLGYRYAIECGFDYVALLHGDGQYPAEMLPELLAPLVSGEAEAVLGSRMKEPGRALRGGMPRYKYVGNRILTTYQNLLLGTSLSEFHTGFRAYSVAALAAVPFQYATSDFHFDTEVLIQLLMYDLRITEISIPSCYGDEVCRVNGLRYAWDVSITTLVSRLQRFGILYRRKYAVRRGESRYESKLAFTSSQEMALEALNPRSRVLDLGCGVGWVAEAAERDKDCRVTGIDVETATPRIEERMSRYLAHDLSDGALPDGLGDEFDTVLLLDVIEHVDRPERLLEELRTRFGRRRPLVVLTTPNVAFVTIRLGLLLGAFNYGERGILDLTHKRLFTFRSLRQLLAEYGFEVHRVRGVPAPFPLALGEGQLARALLAVNRWLVALAPSWFAFQIYVEAEILPTVEEILEQTIGDSETAKRRLASVG